MTHSFDSEIAKKYGLVEAILLQNFAFWIAKNEANDRNYYDGRYWTYNSVKAFQELFPYLTKRKIDYALNKLIDNGLIVTGNYNADRYNHTRWYAFTDFGKSIMQFCEIDDAILLNRSDDFVKSTNTDSKPYINTDNNIMCEIVDYLNQKAKTKYRYQAADTQKHIKARLNEGFTVDDFKTVIDKKVDEWNGTDMQKFIRPSTLFGSKFESYLNQPKKVVDIKKEPWRIDCEPSYDIDKITRETLLNDDFDI